MGKQSYWVVWVFFLVCTLHLVMFSSWGSPFQAETCFDWCAEAEGTGPTKRVPESWISSVSVWQWIASVSCPLIQNKRCGKPGKAQPLYRSFCWRFKYLHMGNYACELPSCIFTFLQIEESLQELVEATSDQLPSDAPAKALKLLHLFRAANEENYEAVWKRFSSRPAYRYRP